MTGGNDETTHCIKTKCRRARVNPLQIQETAEVPMELYYNKQINLFIKPIQNLQ